MAALENKVIVAEGYGSIEVFEATIENALIILSWQTLPEEAVEFANRQPGRFTDWRTVAAVIQRLVKSELGEIVFTSKSDPTNQVVATAEAKLEIMSKLFKNNITVDKITEYQIQAMSISDLSCLSVFHNIPVYSDWVVEMGRKIQIIQNNKWKPSVTDDKKIRYILDLVNEVCREEESYSLSPYRKTA